MTQQRSTREESCNFLQPKENGKKDPFEEMLRDSSIWNAKTLADAPSVISYKYSQLKKLAEERSYYGVMMAVKDCFEVIVRFYVLCGCAISRDRGSEDVVKVLCSPEISLSFGDWVNTLTTSAIKYFGKNSFLGNILQQIRSFYNAHNIVRWRNDYVGHGALIDASSFSYRQELSDKIRELSQIFDKIEPAYDHLTLSFDDNKLWIKYEGELYDASPFLRMEASRMLLFDSMDRFGVSKEIDYYSGKRRIVKSPYFSDLRKKYYGTLNIQQKNKLQSQVYRKLDDKAINAYYDNTAYIKQKYMADWLKQSMDANGKGVFLMLADRATGKSTFSYMLDELGGNKKLLSDTVIRSYYCNRTSIRSFEDFTTSISRMFYETVDGNDFRQQVEGALPDLSRGTDDRPAAVMANLLNFCRQLYERETGTERVLLIIDGLDELETESLPVLGYIPMPDILDENVYILLTCRADDFPAPLLQRFIHNFPFTVTKIFKREIENRDLLKSAIGEAFREQEIPIKEEEKEALVLKYDDRFSVLLLVRAFLTMGIDIRNIEPEQMYLTYLQKIQAIYGEEQHDLFLHLLLTVYLSQYQLTMREAVFMATGESMALHHLAMFYDMKPLVIHYHNLFGGLLLGIGDSLISKIILKEYEESIADMLDLWYELILSYENTLPEEMDGYASICVHFLELNEKYRKAPCAFAVLEHLNYAGAAYSGSRHEMFVLMRSRMIYDSIQKYLEVHRAEILEGRCLDQITKERKIRNPGEMIELMRDVVSLNSMKGLFAAHEFEMLSKMEEKIRPRIENDQTINIDIKFEYCMNFLIVFKTIGNKNKSDYYTDKCLELYPGACEEHQKVFLWNYLNAIKDTKPEECIDLCRKVAAENQRSRTDLSKLKYFEGVAMFSLLLSGKREKNRAEIESVIHTLDTGIQYTCDAALCPQNHEVNMIQGLLHTAKSKAARVLCENYDIAVREARTALNIHHFHMNIGNEDSYNNYFESYIELVRALNLRGKKQDLEEAYENLKSTIQLLENADPILHPYICFNLYVEYAVVIMQRKGTLDELEQVTKKTLMWAEKMPGGESLLLSIKNNLLRIEQERKAGNTNWIYEMSYKDGAWQTE